MVFHRRFCLVVVLVLAGALLLLGGCARDGQPDNGQARVAELEAENAALQAEKEELESRVASLQEEVRQLREGADGEDINRQPREGWEQYFPDPETTTLTGESPARVRELLGRPPYLIRSIAAVPEYSREIWIYVPYDEDPTGLYLFFKGNRLTDSRLDEFAGLYNSGLLDWEDFWLR